MNKNQCIHPVVGSVPSQDQNRTGREKTAALRHFARLTLQVSARHGDFALGALEKDPKGAPLPSLGNYWSLTHKTAYVGAVVGPEPVGVDIEKIGPRSRALFDRLAAAHEWALSENRDEFVFHRFWTAKEAVLKSVGKGLTGLSDCRIKQIIDNRYLLVEYKENIITIEHQRIGKHHLAAVTVGRYPIRWHIFELNTHGHYDDAIHGHVC